ncbi:MAG: EF-hand domain-containing protein [Alphaproteobacteria bacterium]|nr:EF-hand domain-containing protein [Alphaproteobacteria bacterium]
MKTALVSALAISAALVALAPPPASGQGDFWSEFDQGEDLLNSELLFRQIDANENGWVDRSEWAAWQDLPVSAIDPDASEPHLVFADYDADGDGRFSLGEFRRANRAAMEGRQGG